MPDELQRTRDALASDQNSITLALRLGRALIDAAWDDGGDETWALHYTEAAEIYRKVLSQDADNAIALVNFGVVLSDRGFHKQALDQYRRAEANDWIDGNLQHNIGVALVNLSDDESGIRYLQKAATQPDHPQTIKAYFDPQAH